ncbi:YccF domain-containing protein [Hellea sp.]|nr:YccF domain-containing protein [Hellea sp.]
MRLIGNILWIIFGGWLTALLWLLAALLMAISIIGLPWARSCVMIARFSFLPFGYRLVNREALTGRGDIGTGSLGLLGNIIWVIFAGWYLALSHLILGALWCVTIIGIPFGVAHFRLMKASFMPIGKSVISAKQSRA